jgi:hypothetical protein
MINRIHIFFFVALIFMAFVAYNIDIIQDRRSHARVYRIPRENRTGWSTGNKIKKTLGPFISRHAQYRARVGIDGEL